MNEIDKILFGFSTTSSRWARFGPYYAMFPLKFAFDVVNKYSKVGDNILDPFAGRCSSIFAAAILGRNGFGIEINPVGWIYGSVKLNPASKNRVVKRLNEIYLRRNLFSRQIKTLPPFYRVCFCDDVLKFLLSARDGLDWKNNQVDRTLMAILLVHLHGKIGEGLSNQMRMTKSMGMEYSLRWWRKNKMSKPPEINPYEFIVKKIAWRYEKGTLKYRNSSIVCGNSSTKLKSLSNTKRKINKKYSLLLTSPPYYSVTNYFADQWLRLWLMGFDDKPYSIKDKNKGRFLNKESYHKLLDSVFMYSSKLMTKNNTIYVRTDKRKYTFDTTMSVLKKHFPKHKVKIEQKPIRKNTKTQTKLFGDKSLKPGEVDIILYN